MISHFLSLLFLCILSCSSKLLNSNYNGILHNDNTHDVMYILPLRLPVL